MIYKHVHRTPKQVTVLLLVTLLSMKMCRERSIKMWPSVEVVAGKRSGRGLGRQTLFPLTSCRCFHCLKPTESHGEQGAYCCAHTRPGQRGEEWQTDLEGWNGKSLVWMPFLYLVEFVLVIYRYSTYTDISLASSWAISVWESHCRTCIHFIFGVSFSLHWVKICLPETFSPWSCYNSLKR